jgi:retinol-binding protein 3
MQKHTFVCVLVLFVLPNIFPLHAQQSKIVSDPGYGLSAAERITVIEAIVQKVNACYVYPDVAQRMTEAIRVRQANHEYDKVSDPKEFARLLTADLKAVSNDGHLGVEYSIASLKEKAVEEPSAEEIAKFRLTGARNNYNFRKVEHLDGNIGLVQLDAFYPADWIKEPASGAMAFMANADAVIIDLRRNHGFAPDGVILIESYFFKDETHVTDQIDRDADKTRQYWTMPIVPGPSLADKDLYILTSHDTFSAGEDFAYNMQAQGRAKIVGENTGGGAHGTKPYRLSEHFTISIPFSYSTNPITHSDWEGVGVKPDVEVPADQALLTAHILALRTVLKRAAVEPERTSAMQRIISEKEQELDALKNNATSK